jgi:hypothetical protein
VLSVAVALYNKSYLLESYSRLFQKYQFVFGIKLLVDFLQKYFAIVELLQLDIIVV